MASVDSTDMTVEKLKTVMKNTVPPGVKKSAAARIQPAGGALSPLAMFQQAGAPDDPYNEVCQNIYLGDFNLAQDKEKLQQVGITHVVNAAQGSKFNQINTTAEYYADIDVKFLGVGAIDTPRFQMQKHFYAVADFIQEAIEDTGKVYVHCQQGLSRSATLVLAFLMLKKSLSLEEAAILVRQQRLVMPNDGFLQQLVDLDKELQCLKRLYGDTNGPCDSTEASGVTHTVCNGDTVDMMTCINDTVSKQQSLDTNCDGGETVVSNEEKPHSTPLTLEDVKEVLHSTVPPDSVITSKKKGKNKGKAGTILLVRNGNRSSPAFVNDIDEVYPGICIGNHKIARDTRGLKALGITHILNTAQGEGSMQVDTSEAYYADAGITFCGIPGKDIAAFKLHKHFDVAVEFIAKAITSNGKVLVHCHQGRSRSAAVVLAYLMLKEHMPLLQTITVVRQKRFICPNDGFLLQLIDLNSQLFGTQY